MKHKKSSIRSIFGELGAASREDPILYGKALQQELLPNQQHKHLNSLLLIGQNSFFFCPWLHDHLLEGIFKGCRYRQK